MNEPEWPSGAPGTPEDQEPGAAKRRRPYGSGDGGARPEPLARARRLSREFEAKLGERYGDLSAIDDVVRAVTRGLLAEKGVSQARLARLMGISQANVSYMLSRRGYGLTSAEIAQIELVCLVRHGTIWRRANLIEDPTAEQLVYEIPDIPTEAAEGIVANIRAVRAELVKRPAWKVRRSIAEQHAAEEQRNGNA